MMQTNPFDVTDQMDEGLNLNESLWDDTDSPSKWKYNDTDEKGNQTVTVVRRVLSPCIITQQAYVPIRFKNQEGKTVRTNVPVIFKRVGRTKFEIPPILTVLDRADIRAKKEMNPDEENPARVFRPSLYYWYLVFCREDKELKVRTASYNKTISQGLNRLKNTVHPAKKTKTGEPVLLHGPTICYDVFITKTLEKGKSKRRGTEYSVDADPDNDMAGRIPKYVLEKGFPQSWKWDAVFTPEELEAINSFLNEEGVSTTNEYLRKMAESSVTDEEEFNRILQRFDITARDGDYPIFPNQEGFMNALKAELGDSHFLISAGSSDDGVFDTSPDNEEPPIPNTPPVEEGEEFIVDNEIKKDVDAKKSAKKETKKTDIKNKKSNPNGKEDDDFNWTEDS
jgi:hypothetical protein